VGNDVVTAGVVGSNLAVVVTAVACAVVVGAAVVVGGAVVV
jgi:hypothetical protein